MKKIILGFIKIMLFLVLFSGTIASSVSAVITVMPDSSASKVSRLGYKAVCSFTPVSTLVLAIMALVFGVVLVRVYGRRIFRTLSSDTVE